MSKHTQGPWYVLKPGNVALDDLANLQDRTWSVFADSFGSKVHHIVRGTEEANARLIAAAPELLENFQKAINLIEHMQEKFGYCVQVTINDGRKLIAKAEGRD